jgi:hypothetical protein
VHLHGEDVVQHKVCEVVVGERERREFALLQLGVAFDAERDTTAFAEVIAALVLSCIAGSVFGAADYANYVFSTMRHSDCPAVEGLVAIVHVRVADIGVARVEHLATESLEGLPGGLVARGVLEKIRLQDVVVVDGARGVVTVFYIHLCAASAYKRPDLVVLELLVEVLDAPSVDGVSDGRDTDLLLLLQHLRVERKEHSIVQDKTSGSRRIAPRSSEVHRLEVRYVALSQVIRDPHPVVDADVRLSPLVGRPDRITKSAAHTRNAFARVCIDAGG